MAKKDFIIQDGLDSTGETVLGILNVPITISIKYAANNIEEYRWTLITPYKQKVDIGTNDSTITFSSG